MKQLACAIRFLHEIQGGVLLALDPFGCQCAEKGRLRLLNALPTLSVESDFDGFV